MRHRCIVFPGLQSDVSKLLEATFLAHLVESPDTPFEFTALEAVLSTITTWHATQVAQGQLEANVVLNTLDSADRPRDEFERLRVVQRRFDELKTRVQGIHSLLATFLDNDDDLHHLYLTKLHNDPMLYDDWRRFDADEATSLVEVYAQRTFTTLSAIVLQLTKANNTESSLHLKWTSKRNQLLLVDVPLKLLFVGMWIASFWTAAAAMNVESPWSNLDDGGLFFWCVFGGLALVGCGVFVAAVVYLRQRGIRVTFSAPMEVPSVAPTLASMLPTPGSGDVDVDSGRPALYFDATGTFSTQVVSRSEIFTRIQRAAADVPDVNDAPASDHPVDIPPVHMRDIRMLETALAVSNEPAVSVRQQAILINCDPIRAVIFRDSCLVLGPVAAVDSALVQRIQKSFHDRLCDATDAAVGFEFTALETILAAKCQLLADDLYKLGGIGRQQLEWMAADETNMSVLDNLRMVKNAMSDLELQVNAFRRMLMDILDSDEELHMLHLTKLHRDPALALDLFAFDTEEAESLLETYLQTNYSTGAAVELMLYNIQNTESIVLMKLDAKRNYLIVVDLLLTLATTAIAIPNFIVNAFAMNLVSGVKQLDGMFWTLIAVAAACPVVMYVAALRHLRKTGVNVTMPAK
ncbi:hypothetical protein, variant 2 [Aphanomyces invadans]|nr:hypothetical protein, variant 2 [Aphanomyces invadans]ETW05824.1 hypothetical protein, variant 2 [Aphanomyces invadans]|eukprot:XP_008865603.1 hypothetical protein, variant 2 [Aphanomyces invadans]